MIWADRFTDNKPEFENLVGMRYGILTVLGMTRKIDHKSHSVIYWICQCDCGNKRLMLKGNLKHNKSGSCGCINRTGLVKRNIKRYGESSLNDTFSIYKIGARKRGLEFVLTKEEFVKLTKQNCFYCGQEPSNLKKNRANNGDYLYSGIDRLDSSMGYILENCVPCCFTCNSSKSNRSKESFINWIKKVYEYSVKEEMI